jgi:hypothetical protein
LRRMRPLAALEIADGAAARRGRGVSAPASVAMLSAQQTRLRKRGSARWKFSQFSPIEAICTWRWTRFPRNDAASAALLRRRPSIRGRAGCAPRGPAEPSRR